ncbi:hypothetical protein ACIBCN_18640 [Nocardia sp. NPDC051052]|uniref:hypothetical protein n=1 Tax=Nocardia sp. NPDC051052 TaxID=3364322 RepID=UPI0037AF1618
MTPTPPADAEVLRACHYLRTVGRLPCHVAEDGLLNLPVGGDVLCLRTPEDWGYQVKAQLNRDGLTAPIMWHPTKWLVILANGPLVPDEIYPRYLESLYRTGSVLLNRGRPLILPTPGDETRGWDTPVRDHFRPGLTSVLAALDTCYEREHRRQIGRLLR